MLTGSVFTKMDGLVDQKMLEEFVSVSIRRKALRNLITLQLKKEGFNQKEIDEFFEVYEI